MARTRASLLRRTYLSIRPARPRRGRFWLETAFGLACALLFVLTLVMPAWIEGVFRVDPDQGSASISRSRLK